MVSALAQSEGKPQPQTQLGTRHQAQEVSQILSSGGMSLPQTN